eukprot:scaffold14007_cov67-Phaeocystis_antarctica.AAC.2
MESGQPEASDPRRYDMHSSNSVCVSPCVCGPAGGAGEYIERKKSQEATRAESHARTKRELPPPDVDPVFTMLDGRLHLRARGHHGVWLRDGDTSPLTGPRHSGE